MDHVGGEGSVADRDGDGRVYDGDHGVPHESAVCLCSDAAGIPALRRVVGRGGDHPFSAAAGVVAALERAEAERAARAQRRRSGRRLRGGARQPQRTITLVDCFGPRCEMSIRAVAPHIFGLGGLLSIDDYGASIEGD
jgi:hypothetical protein